MVFALFSLLVLGVAVCVVSAFRHVVRLGDPLLAYQTEATPVIAKEARCFIGGCRTMTLRASWGLVRLTLSQTQVVLGPSLRPFGVIVPTWVFPAGDVTLFEPVTTWPNLAGVRIWIRKQPLVFLPPGGSRRVIETAHLLGYDVSTQLLRIGMTDMRKSSPVMPCPAQVVAPHDEE